MDPWLIQGSILIKKKDMLFENGKPYELTQRQISIVYKKLNLPIRIVYTSEQIKKSRLNPVPDKPASINLPLKVNLRTVEGYKEYRYAENIVQDPAGKTKYTPHSLAFFGDKLLTEYDIEFIWFILFWCPYCKNNELEPQQRKRARFEIEDAVTKAELESAVKRNIAKVNTMIYDLDVGLSEENLRKVAKAYFIPGIDKLTRSQVELVLEGRIFAEERSKKQGLKRFLQLTNADEELATRGKIQAAIDQDILKYVPTKSMWAWLNDKGKPGQEICRITGGTNPYEALHDWMAVNDEFKGALDDHLKGQSVIEKKPESVMDRTKGGE